MRMEGKLSDMAERKHARGEGEMLTSTVSTHALCFCFLQQVGRGCEKALAGYKKTRNINGGLNTCAYDSVERENLMVYAEGGRQEGVKWKDQEELRTRVGSPHPPQPGEPQCIYLDACRLLYISCDKRSFGDKTKTTVYQEILKLLCITCLSEYIQIFQHPNEE